MNKDQYKAERQRRGTQQGVAALLGVDYRTIQRRESGGIVVTTEAALAIRALPVRWAAGAGRGVRKPSPARSMPCSAAEVESEVCEQCEGVGSISYNPNLNPNAFPAMASAKCRHCGGTGSVEKTKPQPNDGKLCNSPEAARPPGEEGSKSR